MPWGSLFYKGSEREMKGLTEMPRESDPCGRHELPSGSNTIPQPSIGLSEKVQESKSTDPKESDDLRSKLHDQELELSQLRKKCNGLIQTQQTTANENQYLLMLVSQGSQELDLVKQRNNSLKQELQACKDDLFKMQPRARVSDSDIAQAYDNLHEQISSWMEGEISRFEAGFRRQLNGPLPNLSHHGNLSVAKNFLSAYPTSGGEYFIRMVTQYLLQEMVFAGDILLLGLDEADTALLRRIERSLGKSKPPRDPESINTWRSDTLSALSTTRDFQQRREVIYSRIWDSVFHGPAKYFPFIQKTQESRHKLFDQVIVPAINLANTMQTSATKYKFVPTMKEVSPFKDYTLMQDDLSSSKVIDVATAKTLKVDSPVEANARGQIGRQILLLAPALYRQDSEHSGLLLVKKVVLVELDKPLGKRGRTGQEA
ncbi:MAG: hypothetical protein Q9181_002357 [Wetmoreana brouardii]